MSFLGDPSPSPPSDLTGLEVRGDFGFSAGRVRGSMWRSADTATNCRCPTEIDFGLVSPAPAALANGLLVRTGGFRVGPPFGGPEFFGGLAMHEPPSEGVFESLPRRLNEHSLLRNRLLLRCSHVSSPRSLASSCVRGGVKGLRGPAATLKIARPQRLRSTGRSRFWCLHSGVAVLATYAVG